MKKIVILTLALGLFSMINCLALQITLNNPYHEQGVKMIVKPKYEKNHHNQGSDGSWSIGSNESSVTYIFSENLYLKELKAATSVECQVGILPGVKDKYEWKSKAIPFAVKSYAASNLKHAVEQTFTEQFTWKNQPGEIRYKIRVTPNNGEIALLEVTILKATIAGVDIAHKNDL